MEFHKHEVVDGCESLRCAFGAVEYKRVGEIAILKIMGLAIYKQVGEISVLFGVNFNANP